MAERTTRPYVDALFALADARTVEAMLPALSSFAAAVAASPALQGFFRNPAVPRERKEGALDALRAHTGIEGMPGRLLSILLANHRLLQLGDLIRAIQERIDRDRNVVEARLATPAPIPDADAERIRAALEGRTGRTVRLARAVDPALLGGFVVQVGSEVYDASIAQRLKRARQALHQGAEGHHG